MRRDSSEPEVAFGSVPLCSPVALRRATGIAAGPLSEPVSIDRLKAATWARPLPCGQPIKPTISALSLQETLIILPRETGLTRADSSSSALALGVDMSGHKGLNEVAPTNNPSEAGAPCRLSAGLARPVVLIRQGASVEVVALGVDVRALVLGGLV